MSGPLLGAGAHSQRTAGHAYREKQWVPIYAPSKTDAETRTWGAISGDTSEHEMGIGVGGGRRTNQV